MLNSENIKAIYEEVKENSKALEQCSTPHDFVKCDNSALPKWKCTKCGGTVNNSARYWYIQGLEHGKKA